MSTSTFDKVFVVEKREDIERLSRIINSVKLAPSCKIPPPTPEEFARNEALLEKYLKS